MRATVEWMSQKYDEMNVRLFNGELGACDFGIFTSGKGSQGGVLGWFKLTSRGIKVNRQSRRMFKSGWDGELWINRKNFVSVCRPMIELNGHYSGLESSLLATLVHEMCHYYTYMYGYCPRQGHGREFKDIAAIVSSRSNGEFSIQRVATAEDMRGYELDAEMTAKREARVASKKSKMIACFVFKKNGEIELTLTSNRDVVTQLEEFNTRFGRRDSIERIVISQDARLIDFFYGLGFRKSFRTYRYWSINPTMLGGKNFLDNGGYDYKVVFGDETKNLIAANNVQKQSEVQPSSGRKMLFSIKTSNGIVEIPFNGSYTVLKNKLRERFPNMKDEVLDKIMQNKANYRIQESKDMVGMIVESVIDEYFENEFMSDDDSIDISPNMNLGLMSPLESEDV